ncbi:peptidase inhibitor family I36 protein [Streptomyces melanosporofaciens]|uniref:peptidase inhibitor family I36 protein n=1 Tax=unclassified Streptomyces TaxID=2593676 RepID=UPI0036A3E6F0
MKKRTYASLGSVGAAAVLFVTASAASANWSSHIDSTEVGAAAAWDCPSQSICFYTSKFGQGKRCVWPARQNDPDWTSGDLKCSWASSDPTVRSIRVMPALGSVSYYPRKNYGGSRGCVNGGAPGAKKSFAAAQRVLSHTTTGSGCEI